MIDKTTHLYESTFIRNVQFYIFSVIELTAYMNQQ